MEHRKVRYLLPEALALLSMSRTKAYEQAAAGRLRFIKDCGRIYVTAAEIDRYSAACEAGPGDQVAA